MPHAADTAAASVALRVPLCPVLSPAVCQQCRCQQACSTVCHDLLPAVVLIQGSIVPLLPPASLAVVHKADVVGATIRGCEARQAVRSTIGSHLQGGTQQAAAGTQLASALGYVYVWD